MKKVKVRVRDLRDLPILRVGDIVEFQVGEETHTDRITYISGHVIEGEKYALTYTKSLRKIS
jgi:hypothetical protein